MKFSFALSGATRRLLSRFGQHGVLFVLAKAAVLVAPLLAAAKLGESGYGSVEWWIALSMAIGPLVAWGAQGVVAYGTLGGRPRRHTRTAVMFVLQAAAVLVVISMLSPVLGFGWERSIVGPVSLQCAVVALQLTLSARLKGLGKGAWASLAESMLYLCLLGAVLLTIFGATFVASFMALMLIACLLLASGLRCTVPLPSIRQWPRRNYRVYLRVGAQFMAGGALAGLFMAAPRALLGIVASPEAVARFAITFRWLSIAILAHQLVNTFFFRQLYGERAPAERDRALAAVVALVGLVAAGIALISGTNILAQHSLPGPGPDDRILVWLMAGVMVCWSGTACLEGSLYRVGGEKAQLLSALAGLIAFAVAGGVAIVIADPVIGLGWAWIIGFLATIGWQVTGLAKQGTHFPILKVAVVSCLVLITAMAMLFEGSR